MGLSRKISGGTSFWAQPVKGEPVPHRFEIKFAYRVGKFIVTRVCYPDCTNYEGIKILVFEGITLTELYRMSAIDPHFSEGSNIIARFAPTDHGMRNAIRFCQMADKY